MNSQSNIDYNIKNISSVECFDELSKNSKSYLIDVRTKPEWDLLVSQTYKQLINEQYLIVQKGINEKFLVSIFKYLP